jgi:hypothetical protein
LPLSDRQAPTRNRSVTRHHPHVDLIPEPVPVGSSDGVLDLHWLAVRIVDRSQHAEHRHASRKPQKPSLIGGGHRGGDVVVGASDPASDRSALILDEGMDAALEPLWLLDRGACGQASPLSARGRPGSVASGEDPQEEQEHVQDVQEDRGRQQRR